MEHPLLNFMVNFLNSNKHNKETLRIFKSTLDFPDGLGEFRPIGHSSSTKYGKVPLSNTK